MRKGMLPPWKPPIPAPPANPYAKSMVSTALGALLLHRCFTKAPDRVCFHLASGGGRGTLLVITNVELKNWHN